MVNANEEDVYIDKDIIKFVYIISMRDATLRKAYKGERKWLTKWDVDNKNEKVIFSETGYKKPIINFINDVVVKGKYNTKNKQQEYDTDFKNLCKAVAKYINSINDSNYKNSYFTFGNAQKLINMMLKYLYIKTYDDIELRKNFICCHCPMDGVMLKRIFSKETMCKYVGKTKYSWSKEDFNITFRESGKVISRYDAFQIEAREEAKKNNLSPLELDYYLWNQL